MKHLIIALPLLLVACATPRENIKQSHAMVVEQCAEKSAGLPNEETTRMHCELSDMKKAAGAFGFNEGHRIDVYYGEKLKAAEAFDAGKISKQAYAKKQAALDAKYADIFDAKTAGGSFLEAEGQGQNFMNQMLFSFGTAH